MKRGVFGFIAAILIASLTAAEETASLAEKVRAVAREVAAMKTFDEKLKKLTELEKRVLADEKSLSSGEAIRFGVALEPLFLKKADLKNLETCRSVRDEIHFKFKSGSGGSGTLPPFALDSLGLLAAVCGDDSLKTP